jgi:hypothetical protein
MNTYKETLEAAKKIIEGLAISAEDKAMLSERVPHLSFDALEVFVWTLEKDPSDISAILQKTRQWMAAQTDPVEIQKAIDKDKKELEDAIAAEEALKQ